MVRKHRFTLNDTKVIGLKVTQNCLCEDVVKVSTVNHMGAEPMILTPLYEDRFSYHLVYCNKCQ